MGSINGIVNVQITAGTAGVTAKSFGVGLIIGGSKNFASTTENRFRVREYTNIAAVKTDYADTTAEYKEAAAYFGQNPRPSRVLIGQKYTDDTGIGEALDEITGQNTAWYLLLLCSRVVSEQVEASQWVQADDSRIFIASSADPELLEIKADDTASIWALAKANDRTFCIYHSAAASVYADGGVAGVISTYQPGSWTLHLKKMRGIDVDSLTDNQRGILHDKGVNTYTEIGGASCIEGSKTLIATGSRETGGEWLDIIVFADWLRARIAEGVFGVMLNAKKIPYTMQGAAMIESPTRSVLEIGQSVGGISPASVDEDDVQNGGFSVTVVDPATMPTADKQARKYDGVSFVAFLAGAMHYTQINGTITY